MKKLTLKHSEAVSAAKMSLSQLLDRNTSLRWKRLIEEQIVLMGEVYWWVLNNIYQPGLQFPEPSDNDEKPEPEEPQDNGSASGSG